MTRTPARVIQARLLTKAEAAADELLSLKEAAALAFPNGLMGASGLRRERDRGRLRTYMIAGKEFTTLENIREMVEKCAVTPKAPVSGSVRSERTAEGLSPTKANGSSETGQPSAALVSALATVEELKARFKDTSRASMSQPGRSASRIKSRSAM